MPAEGGKKAVFAFVSQGYRAPAVGQPPGAGHPQRLPHVRQPGLDRPVAPRSRRSHGGAARGSSGLRTGAEHTWSWCTERAGNLEPKKKKDFLLILKISFPTHPEAAIGSV